MLKQIKKKIRGKLVGNTRIFCFFIIIIIFNDLLLLLLLTFAFCGKEKRHNAQISRYRQIII